MYTSLNIEFSWLCFIFMATIDDQCVMRLQHNQRVPPIKCICMWNKHLNCVKNRKWKWKVLPYPGFFLWTLPIKINLSNMERATSFYFFFLFFFLFIKRRIYCILLFLLIIAGALRATVHSISFPSARMKWFSPDPDTSYSIASSGCPILIIIKLWNVNGH